MQTDPVSLRVSLSLPPQTIAAYEHRAVRRSRSLESEIATTLQETQQWISDQPLYISDSERKALEKALGRNLGNSRALVEAVEKLGRVRLPVGAQINLQEPVIARLQSRCPRQEKFSLFLERTMRNLLEQYVGLR